MTKVSNENRPLSVWNWTIEYFMNNLVINDFPLSNECIYFMTDNYAFYFTCWIKNEFNKCRVSLQCKNDDNMIFKTVSYNPKNSSWRFGAMINLSNTNYLFQISFFTVFFEIFPLLSLRQMETIIAFFQIKIHIVYLDHRYIQPMCCKWTSFSFTDL